MKAICVTPNRELEVREVPTPTEPAPGHLLIDMAASAINPGDKTFLKLPIAAGNAAIPTRYDVWGASGAGRVVTVGSGVPTEYAGKQVAIYRSLGRTPESVGLWCERAQMPYTNCLILPEHVQAKNYSGSLVNVITAYAFLEELATAGHRGVIATAGNSATGYALASLARRRKLPAILLVRTEAAREELHRRGVEHVLVINEGLTDTLGSLSAKLGATAVFDGVGGGLIGKIAPSLPANSTVYCYGFLAGAEPLAIPSSLLMMKNLVLRRFSNFESMTVKEPGRLESALNVLKGISDDPMFVTRLGTEFRYDQIQLAMAYNPSDATKAVLVA
jgi:NADPH2:quinone reductase